MAGETADAEVLLWSTRFRCWAQFRMRSGMEITAAEQMESRVWWEITIRHRQGITHPMRLLYRGRIFNITAVVNRDERNVEQVLTAWEGRGME